MNIEMDMDTAEMALIPLRNRVKELRASEYSEEPAIHDQYVRAHNAIHRALEKSGAIVVYEPLAFWAEIHNPMVKEIQEYALAHYDEAFFWSQIVECYEEDDIVNELKMTPAETVAEFAEKHADIIDALEDRFLDGINSRF